jgi:flagellar biosynthesis GTPase FlhF
MHDLLRPLEDLKEIKKSLGENTDNKTMKLIDTKIAEYESDIKAVEEYLKNELQKYDNSILEDINTAHATESVQVMGVTGFGDLPDDIKVTYDDEEK